MIDFDRLEMITYKRDIVTICDMYSALIRACQQFSAVTGIAFEITNDSISFTELGDIEK